ncbi:MAG: hypothetical protein QNJ88_00925 [Acidimicrobiia bacterium]|nr:hypothetical protein [Acidimicrobiia bacterium]
MEAWESSDQIRPLPPEAPPEGPGPDRGRTPRSWLPLAIAAAALGAFAVGSALFARTEPTDVAATTTTTSTTTTVPSLAADAPATTTTTTIPRPPTLSDRVPNVSQVFTVMAEGMDTTIEWWSVGFREALAFDVASSVTSAVFNLDGSLLGLLSTEGEENGTLRIGEPTSIGTRFVDVSSFAWHDTFARDIAFIATLPLDDEPSLLTATVANASFDLLFLRRVAPVAEDARVVAWGEWGIALVGSEPRVVTIERNTSEVPYPVSIVLDAEGNELARTDGWIVDALPGGPLLIRTFWQVDETAEDGVPVLSPDYAVTRTDVSFAPDGRFDLLTASSVAFLNPNGTHMSEVTTNPSGITLITSRRFDRPSNRSASVPGFHEPLGFTRDGSLFIVHDLAEGELVFVDWGNSRQYRVPTGLGRAIAVDTR